MPKAYRLELLPKVRKELDDIPEPFFSKIDKSIQALSKNPRPFGVKKLDNNLHRIRIGPFRVIYAVVEKEEKIVLLHAARRSEKTYRSF